MESGPQYVISASDSGDSQRDLLVVRGNCKTQLDNEFQHKLISPSTGSISPLESPSSDGVQCLTSSPSLAMSSIARGSNSEVLTGLQHGWELFHDRDPDARAPFPQGVHMITADGDDASTSVQQPEFRTRNDLQLAVETSSCPTPADSNATAGFRSDSYEQLTKSHGTQSPNLVPPQSNSGLIVAAATRLKCLSNEHVADKAFAKILPDEPSYTSGVALTIRPRTSQAESQRNGSIERKSRPKSPWTSEQDELLLHLRDTAQLNWRSIVSYFPGVTLSAVKSRYKHLNECRVPCQIVGIEPKSRVSVRRRTTHLAASTSQKAAKKCRTPSRAKSRRQPVSILAGRHSTPHRRDVIKHANNAKYGALVLVCLAWRRTQRPWCLVIAMLRLLAHVPCAMQHTSSNLTSSI